MADDRTENQGDGQQGGAGCNSPLRARKCHDPRDVLDRSYVITYRMSLNEAASGYSRFQKDKDACIKIVMKPELN